MKCHPPPHLTTSEICGELRVKAHDLIERSNLLRARCMRLSKQAGQLREQAERIRVWFLRSG